MAKKNITKKALTEGHERHSEKGLLNINTLPIKPPPMLSIRKTKKSPYGYENYEVEVAEIEVEFTSEQLAIIDAAVKAGGFVSRGELIRHALREAMKDNKFNG